MPAAAPVEPEVPAPPAEPERPPRPRSNKRYNVEMNHESVVTFLQRLAQEEGVEVRCVGFFRTRLSLKMSNASFEEVLAAICKGGDFQTRVAPDGAYLVGYPQDLVVALAGPRSTTEVVTFYHCQTIDPESLATVLGQAFPALKVLTGPNYDSPTLEFEGASASFGGGMGGMGGGMPNGGGMPGTAGGPNPKGFTTQNIALKRDDIVMRGPAWVVREALALAHKLDRLRRQVRINLRMVEISSTASEALGLTWTFGAAGGTSTTVTELSNPALTNPVSTASGSATFVGNKGLQFGSFGHTPVSFNVLFAAQEQKGTVKTLANPSMMVLDGERCFIHLGDKLLYPKQNGVNANGLPTYDVAEIQTGVYLQIAVDIGDEDDLVLSLYPQDSYVSSYQTYNGNQYPVISTREAQTTVRLQSGQLMAIGGLRQDQDLTADTTVPGLASIPILGKLFSSKNPSSSKDDLVLMIQPVIEEYEGSGTSSIASAPPGSGQPQG